MLFEQLPGHPNPKPQKFYKYESATKPYRCLRKSTPLDTRKKQDLLTHNFWKLSYGHENYNP